MSTDPEAHIARVVLDYFDWMHGRRTRSPALRAAPEADVEPGLRRAIEDANMILGLAMLANWGHDREGPERTV